MRDVAAQFDPIRYLSVCSGVESASLAFEQIGWEPAAFSEIDPAPSRVLTHRWPHVPNHGDFTTIEGHEYGRIDLLVGGTPCQGFSNAGRRGGLDDARSVLSLEFGRLAVRCGARWFLWENVPGALSLNNGRDFGAILACFAGYPDGHVFEPPANGWKKWGIVRPAGPGCFGLAWCVRDLQWFGVAQRRARLFVVGYLGDWRPAAAALFNPEGMRGDPAPCREKGQAVAALTANGVGTCGADDNQGQAGHLIAHTLKGEGFDGSEDGTGRGVPLVPLAFGGETRRNIEVAGCISAAKGQRQDFDVETFIAAPVAYRTSGNCGAWETGDTVDTLTTGTDPNSHVIAIQERAVSENPDAGPAGKGWQADLAYTLEARQTAQAVAFDTTQVTSPSNFSNPQPGDPCHPLTAQGHAPAIAFNCKQTDAAPSSEVTPTLRAMNSKDSNQNAGGQLDVAVSLRGREDGGAIEIGDNISNALRASQGGGDKAYMFDGYAVRRLSPRECERLMGYPDDHTRVPVKTYKTQPNGSHFMNYPDHYECQEDGTWVRFQADGPRYKQCGNGQGVAVMRWIAERIDAVDKLIRTGAAA